MSMLLDIPLMNDAQFLCFIEDHCDAVKPLFHKSGIIRMLRLANENLLADHVQETGKEYIYMYRKDCQPYLDKIALISKKKHLTLVVNNTA